MERRCVCGRDIIIENGRWSTHTDGRTWPPTGAKGRDWKIERCKQSGRFVQQEKGDA